MKTPSITLPPRRAYKKRKINVATVLSVITLTFFTVFALVPFLFLLISSFKPGSDIVRYGINLRFNPDALTLKNYVLLWTERNGIYLHWFKNSILITVLQTVLSVFLSSMVGYGLAVYQFRGRNLIFLTVLAVMVVPLEILILPLYKLTVSLRIINSFAGVILPFAVPAFAVFFFRQYALGLSKDLIDAGRIDGCSEFGIFFKIMMPLMLPAFGAMVILQAMFSWNNFVWPLIVLRSNENLTIPIGLASLITPYGHNYDMLMSGAVMSVIPILIVFLFNQRAFVSGLTIGGIKG